MAVLPRPVTMMTDSTPDRTASSTTYCMSGLSTSGSISFGDAFVAGRKRVPSPAAGNTAFRTFAVITRHYSFREAVETPDISPLMQRRRKRLWELGKCDDLQDLPGSA